MPWWCWVVLGIALFVAEMAWPTDFFLFFFGLSAVVVGLALGAGLAGPPWLPWLLFGTIAAIALVSLRRPLRERLGRPAQHGSHDGVVGEIALLAADLEPGGVGKAELRGSVWSVRSREGRRLEAGRRVRVERVEGLTLWVVAEGPSSGPESGGSAGQRER